MGTRNLDHPGASVLFLLRSAALATGRGTVTSDILIRLVQKWVQVTVLFRRPPLSSSAERLKTAFNTQITCLSRSSFCALFAVPDASLVSARDYFPAFRSLCDAKSCIKKPAAFSPVQFLSSFRNSRSFKPLQHFPAGGVPAERGRCSSRGFSVTRHRQQSGLTVVAGTV